jgi:hypothetical protein
MRQHSVTDRYDALKVTQALGVEPVIDPHAIKGSRTRPAMKRGYYRRTTDSTRQKSQQNIWLVSMGVKD